MFDLIAVDYQSKLVSSWEVSLTTWFFFSFDELSNVIVLNERENKTIIMSTITYL